MARFGLRRVGARSAPERRRHRSCGCAAYAPFELQDRHDGDAGGKTSEVGEVRDVRGLVADDAEDVERRDQLQQQPFAEDEDGGQGHRSDDRPTGTSTRTRPVGTRVRYAPRIPEIAPDAPTRCVEPRIEFSTSPWAIAAIQPAKR